MNILVTGACGGMGLAACDRLATEGHTVFGTDIAQPGQTPKWQFIRADLTNEEDVRQIADFLQKKGIRLDAIIHHAGIYNAGSLVEMPDAQMKKIWDINLLAAVRVNRYCIDLLKPGARIILTSSELAPLNPLPFTGIYGITKAAVEKYAFSLRMEVQLLGIQVSVIRPGAIRTPLLGISTKRLDAFTNQTTHYRCNAERFDRIVNSVETRSVQPEKIAELDLKILNAKHPRYIYSINRNPALRLLNILPDRLQTAIIRRILG